MTGRTDKAPPWDDQGPDGANLLLQVQRLNMRRSAVERLLSTYARAAGFDKALPIADSSPGFVLDYSDRAMILRFDPTARMLNPDNNKVVNVPDAALESAEAFAAWWLGVKADHARADRELAERKRRLVEEIREIYGDRHAEALIKSLRS